MSITYNIESARRGFILTLIKEPEYYSGLSLSGQLPSHARYVFASVADLLRFLKEQLDVVERQQEALNKIRQFHCTAHPQDLKQNRVETAVAALAESEQLLKSLEEK